MNKEERERILSIRAFDCHSKMNRYVTKDFFYLRDIERRKRWFCPKIHSRISSWIRQDLSFIHSLFLWSTHVYSFFFVTLFFSCLVDPTCSFSSSPFLLSGHQLRFLQRSKSRNGSLCPSQVQVNHREGSSKWFWSVLSHDHEILIHVFLLYLLLLSFVSSFSILTQGFPCHFPSHFILNSYWILVLFFVSVMNTRISVSTEQETIHVSWLHMNLQRQLMSQSTSYPMEVIRQPYSIIYNMIRGVRQEKTPPLLLRLQGLLHPLPLLSLLVNQF